MTRRNGQEQWVLIHVEVQSQFDPNFERRMALCHHRIADRYGREVCSLAILGDDNPNWRPRCFRLELWGCIRHFQFPIAKLLDYPDYPKAVDNPFAWLVAGQRQAHLTQNDPHARKAVKLRMLRGLCNCGLNEAAIRQFFLPVDWVLALPEKLEYAMRDELARLEAKQVVHITSFERIGRKEGRAEGIRHAIMQVIKTRWNLADSSLVEALQGISDDKRLSAVHESALTAVDSEQWRASLAGQARARSTSP